MRKISMYIIIGLVVLVVLAFGSIYIQNAKPQVDLGVDNGRLKEIPTKPNCVSSQTNQSDKLVKPLVFKESLEETKKAVKEALEAYGAIVIKEETDTYIYAVATTGTMKYHDDIELYFDIDQEVVQYRSASRAGYSDMGLNRERYDAIAKTYNSK